VLQRTTTDVDVAKQLGGAPTMGNLTERFSVLVLVPLVGEDPEPQQFFAGQRIDVKCVCPFAGGFSLSCPMLFSIFSYAFRLFVRGFFPCSRLLHEA
jgi:hypothetical protein